MDSGSSEGTTLTQPLTDPSRKNCIMLFPTGRSLNLGFVLSFSSQKEEEFFCLFCFLFFPCPVTQTMRTISTQAMRTCHNPEFLLSSSGLFLTVTPNFFLSFFTIVCIFQITIPLLISNKVTLLIN